MSTLFSSSGKKKKTISHVKSGIQISELSKDASSTSSSLIPRGFITSRTARVFLAGAGFLADAVLFMK